MLNPGGFGKIKVFIGGVIFGFLLALVAVNFSSSSLRASPQSNELKSDPSVVFFVDGKDAKDTPTVNENVVVKEEKVNTLVAIDKKDPTYSCNKHISRPHGQSTQDTALERLFFQNQCGGFFLEMGAAVGWRKKCISN